MSPSRKSAGPRDPHRSHAHRQHSPAAPPSELPADPPPEACSGFADWADGFAGMIAEHALPPVLRIDAVAWLARVARQPAAGAA